MQCSSLLIVPCVTVVPAAFMSPCNSFRGTAGFYVTFLIIIKSTQSVKQTNNKTVAETGPKYVHQNKHDIPCHSLPWEPRCEENSVEFVLYILSQYICTKFISACEFTVLIIVILIWNIVFPCSHSFV